MVAARRHETPGSEIKDFFRTLSVATSPSTNALLRREQGPKEKVRKIPRRPLQ